MMSFHMQTPLSLFDVGVSMTRSELAFPSGNCRAADGGTEVASDEGRTADPRVRSYMPIWDLSATPLSTTAVRDRRLCVPIFRWVCQNERAQCAPADPVYPSI